MAISYGGDSVNFADGSTLASGRMGMINRIINGDFRVDQRNNGASVTNLATDTYCLDRWQYNASQASKYTVQQNAGSVTPPNGFRNYLGITSTSAYSVGAGDYFALTQVIEGFNTADLMFGTANAKTITLSFQVYSSLTGTFGGSIQNGNNDRSYPFSYTVSNANTWTPISITIAGDTTGTWVGSTNGRGMYIRFGLGYGSTYGGGTAGAWVTGNVQSTSGSVSVVGTSGATFYITGVDLRAGTYATAPTWEFRSYQQELALCQRYYWQTAPSTVYMSRSSSGIAYNTTGIEGVSFSMPVTMRTAPSFSLASAGFYSPYVGRVPNAGTIGVYQGFPDALYLNNANNGSGFGANYPYWISSSSSNSAKFDAEL